MDSLTGFIAGEYKTIDGGETWYPINGGETKVFFINNLVGWSIGGNIIYKSTDGGETWAVQFTHLTSFFTGIFFADSQYGWVSGGRPQKTTDGGVNWVEQTNTDIWNSNDVYVENRDTVWFAKYSDITPSLFRSTDNGINWSPITEVIGARKFFIFPDPKRWVIIGFSRYYITVDDGNSWIEFTNEVPSGIKSFQAPNNRLGYAVGDYGLILRYEDTTYIPIELNTLTADVSNNTVTLKWSTATETNNSGFEVQRLQNYKIAKLQDWKRIGFVEGNGTTTLVHSYSYTDKNVLPGKYYYRLKQIDFDGNYEYSKVIEVEVGSPTKFSLEQNYPNPFNPVTTIKYTIPNVGTSFMKFVQIKVYNTLGEEVATLVNEEKPAGSYTVKFDGSDLPSGVYLYRLNAGLYSRVRKMILIK